jgi:hypothetical protein
MHGKGVYYFGSGNRVEGEWVDGLKQGLGRVVYKNGNLLDVGY